MADTMTFSNLVHEAYIEPLRSVLIVDDQYPTWDEILNDCLGGDEKDSDLKNRSDKKEWRANARDPINVIKQFRSKSPGLIIDIHDAPGEEDTEQADHLHQSDLLVLDYNLEGYESGLGGQKARGILQSILSNNHFNLVVVHTAEPELGDVFFDCLLATMTSCTSQFSESRLSDLEALDEKLNDLESGDEFDRKLLSEKFGPSEYLALRNPNADLDVIFRQYMKSEGPFGALRSWGEEIKLKDKEPRTFFYWAIREFEKLKNEMFSKKEFEGLTWKIDGKCIWLRTVRGFVAFVGKGPYDLLGTLQSALESWQPTPSRLISAKYRYKLSSVGVEAEDRTLQKSHVFAQFYKDFCSPGIPELTEEETGRLRTAKLKAHVTRQSEAISFHIEDAVVRFGEKIRQVDKETTENFASHYSVNLKDDDTPEAKKAVAHYNSYVSTLPLKKGDDQLDSGHIFKWNSEWWVCATPACDLQPGQNTTAFVGNSTKQRPFTALNLLRVDDLSKVTRPHINSGLYCFVEIKPGEVICLGLQSIEASNSVPNGKATWRTFVAENNGLVVDKKMELIVPKFENNKLEIKPGEAEIVAKLRYEYALNYIQKVGSSVTRIGLGYTS